MQKFLFVIFLITNLFAVNSDALSYIDHTFHLVPELHDPTIPTSYAVGMFNMKMNDIMKAKDMIVDCQCSITYIDEHVFCTCIYSENIDKSQDSKNIIDFITSLYDISFDITEYFEHMVDSFVNIMELFQEWMSGTQIVFFDGQQLSIWMTSIGTDIVEWCTPHLEYVVEYMTELVKNAIWSCLRFQYDLTKASVVHFSYGVYTGTIPIWVCVSLMILMYVLSVKIAYFILWKLLQFSYWLTKKTCITFARLSWWSVKILYRCLFCVVSIPFIIVIWIGVISIGGSCIICVTVFLIFKYIFDGLHCMYTSITSYTYYGMKQINYFCYMTFWWTIYFITKFTLVMAKFFIEIFSVLLRLLAVVGCIYISYVTYLIVGENEYDNQHLLVSVLVLSVATISIASVSVLIKYETYTFSMNRFLRWCKPRTHRSKMSGRSKVVTSRSTASTNRNY
jgi:hypothetical protein